MGKKLIDTNAIIELVDKSLPESAIRQLEDWIDAEECIASIINKIEVMSFPLMTEENERDFNDFFTVITIVPLSAEIAQITWQLRRAVKIKLPDAIIAATALYFNLPLITRNADDFKNVPGLIVINPHVIT